MQAYSLDLHIWVIEAVDRQGGSVIQALLLL